VKAGTLKGRRAGRTHGAQAHSRNNTILERRRWRWCSAAALLGSCGAKSSWSNDFPQEFSASRRIYQEPPKPVHVRSAAPPAAVTTVKRHGCSIRSTPASRPRHPQPAAGHETRSMAAMNRAAARRLPRKRPRGRTRRWRAVRPARATVRHFWRGGGRRAFSTPICRACRKLVGEPFGRRTASTRSLRCAKSSEAGGWASVHGGRRRRRCEPARGRRCLSRSAAAGKQSFTLGPLQQDRHQPGTAASTYFLPRIRRHPAKRLEN